jgi:hypothetical protein
MKDVPTAAWVNVEENILTFINNNVSLNGRAIVMENVKSNVSDNVTVNILSTVYFNVTNKIENIYPTTEQIEKALDLL